MSSWNPFPRDPGSLITPEAFRTALNLSCLAFPMDDYVYHFPVTPLKRDKTGNIHVDNTFYSSIKLDIPADKYGHIVVAGSAAISYILEYWARRIGLKKGLPWDWQPNDADLFILGCPKPSRFQMGLVDFVFTTEKTVSELLINFDLPCCRAAVSPSGDVWVSAQCLNALYTGTYNLPAYLKTHDSFNQKVHAMNVGESYMFNRFIDRIRKYTARGFNVNWVETKQILPWVTNRFIYSQMKSN